MKFFSVAALLTTTASTANALIVNTPMNVVQCQTTLITWDPQGSAGPFWLSIHPGQIPSNPSFVSWDYLTGTSLNWVVDIVVPVGQSLIILLRDGNTSTASRSYSNAFTVQAGPTDCLPSSRSVSLPPTSSLSLVPVSSTSIPASPIPIPIPTSVRPSTTFSPDSAPVGGGSSGALSNAVNFGSAGFLAAIIGAVLA